MNACMHDVREGMRVAAVSLVCFSSSTYVQMLHVPQLQPMSSHRSGFCPRCSAKRTAGRQVGG